MSTTFYELRRRDGELVAVHKRTDHPDGSKDFTWLRADGTSGLNGTRAAELPLYGAHRLDGWAAAPIVVVEGEKSAEALWRADVAAVATVGANVIPEPAVLADLAGRSLILWPDADEPGREHMRQLAEQAAELAAVGWLEPPADAPKGWDAADAVAAGADVRELLRDARAWPLPVPYRTLADIDDSPPASLLLGLLEPAGPTLLYAAPGTGKGLTGAWIATELMRQGMRPAIFDAERRPREWARRVGGLGGDRSRVVYVEPADLGARYAGVPLWEATEALAPILRSAGADALLVDSVLPASGIVEERLRSDAAAPFLYVRALDALGIPSVSFGHPPKGRPEGDPFGSMAWLAAMRLTWLGTDAPADGGKRVRWRPRKRNERGFVPGLLLAFDFDADGRPCSVTRHDDEQDTRSWLLAALEDGPKTMAELAELAMAEEEYATAEMTERAKERLGTALNRMRREGLVTREGTSGRSVRWSV
jgi:hypothetical protein